jgi:hypothetical protein
MGRALCPPFPSGVGGTLTAGAIVGLIEGAGLTEARRRSTG